MLGVVEKVVCFRPTHPPFKLVYVSFLFNCIYHVFSVFSTPLGCDKCGEQLGHSNALWNLVIMFKYMDKLGSEAYRFILIKLKGIPPVG